MEKQTLMVLTEEPETGAGQGAPLTIPWPGARGEHGYQSQRELSRRPGPSGRNWSGEKH